MIRASLCKGVPRMLILTRGTKVFEKEKVNDQTKLDAQKCSKVFQPKHNTAFTNLLKTALDPENNILHLNSLAWHSTVKQSTNICSSNKFDSNKSWHHRTLALKKYHFPSKMPANWSTSINGTYTYAIY